MKKFDKEIDRVLTLLRTKIRERGFTQLQVQDQLEWGRSYISQLLTRQKALRLEQILCILDVIGVTPGEFFGELYGSDPAYAGFQTDWLGGRGTADTDLRGQLRMTRELVQGYASLLVEKGMLSRSEVDGAFRTTLERLGSAEGAGSDD